MRLSKLGNLKVELDSCQGNLWHGTLKAFLKANPDSISGAQALEIIEHLRRSKEYTIDEGLGSFSVLRLFVPKALTPTIVPTSPVTRRASQRPCVRSPRMPTERLQGRCEARFLARKHSRLRPHLFPLDARE